MDWYYWYTTFEGDKAIDHVPVKVCADGSTVFFPSNSPAKITSDLIPISGGLRLLGAMSDNLIDLIDTSEPSILWVLKSRFEKNIIYSAIGKQIVVAINPFNEIASLYSESRMQSYLARSLSNEEEAALQPHVWKAARNVYANLRHGAARRSIIFSGECGSGKTHALKKCMYYLSAAGGAALSDSSSSSCSGKVKACFHLLETFGSAATASNHTSSRFGAIYDVKFTKSNDQDLNISGISVAPFLLEISRVAHPRGPQDKRNFHVFYQLCSQYALHDLTAPEDYSILTSENEALSCVQGVDDEQGWSDTLSAFAVLNFSQDDVQASIDALKCILILGNVKFDSEDESEPVYGAAAVSPDSLSMLDSVASMLGIEVATLIKTLIAAPSKGRGENKPLNVQQALSMRDAICNDIYNRTFSFVVGQINKSFFSAMAPSSCGSTYPSISLLDMCGLEMSMNNSLDKLCTNYANEKLELCFINFAVANELQLYRDQLVQLPVSLPHDHSSVLDIIDGSPMSIFSLLDAEALLPEGSDSRVLKMVETHRSAALDSERKKISADCDNSEFSVHHFSGLVKYQIEGFVEMNRLDAEGRVDALLASDETNNAALRVLLKQNNPHIPAIGSTFSSRFKAQFESIMDSLESTGAHYVRCFKSNDSQAESLLESGCLLPQLRYSGVLEVTTFHKMRYSALIPHEEFRQKYWACSGLSKVELQEMMAAYSDREGPAEPVTKNAAICKKIVDRFQLRGGIFVDNICVGTSLVLLQSQALEQLEAEYAAERSAKGTMISSALGPVGRKIIAMNRYVVLDSARRELLQLIDLGALRGSTNFVVLRGLRRMIAHAESLPLRCHVVTNARKLADKLAKLKELLDEMQLYLMGGSFDGAPFYTNTKEELVEGDRLLQNAADLSVAGPEVDQIKTRRIVLVEKCAALDALRDAMGSMDSEKISLGLNAVSVVVERHGHFCQSEETAAKLQLLKLEHDDALLMDMIESINRFHAQCEKEGLADIETFWLKPKVTLVASFSELEFGEGQSSSLAKTIKDACYILCGHAEYNLLANNKWEYLAEHIMALKIKEKEIAGYNSSSKPAIELPKTITKFLSITSTPMHINFLFPMLQKALGEGRLRAVEDEQGQDECEICPGVGYADLQAELDEVRGYLWLDQRTESLLGRIEAVVRVRRCFLADCSTPVGMGPWELVCRITEGEPSFIARQDASAALRNLMGDLSTAPSVQSPSEGASISTSTSSALDSVPQADTNMETLARFAYLQKFASSIGAEIESKSSSADPFEQAEHGILVIIQEELAAARKSAMYRLSLELTEEALKMQGCVKATPAAISNKQNTPPSRWPAPEDASPAPIVALLDALAIYAHCSPHQITIRSYLNALSDSRALFRNKQWSQILSDETFRLTQCIEATPLYASTSASVFALIKTEAINLIRESRNNLSVDGLLSAVASGRISGHVGHLDTASVDTSGLIAAMESSKTRCEAPATASAPYNGMNDKLLRMLNFCKSLITARNAFKTPSLESRKVAINTLDGMLPSIESPLLHSASLDDEMLLMHTEVDYSECLVLLKAGLQVTAPVRYFIPTVATQPSATANNEPAESSLESVLSTHARGNKEEGQNMWSETIAEENLCLNTSVLNTEQLAAGLDVAKRLLRELSDLGHELPTEYVLTIRAADFIRTMRDCVRTGRWAEAANAFRVIKDEGLALKVPIIQEEVLGAAAPINNYLSITVCKNALSRGMGQGEVGAMRLGEIVLEDLDAAILTCMQAGGVKSPHAEALIKAVVAIIDIRRAQKNGDWGALQDALQRADSAGLGKGLTALCANELSRAKLELENAQAIHSLRKAVIEEPIATKMSLLHSAKIQTLRLSDAIATVTSQIPESRIGPVLAKVLVVAEEALKVRKEAQKGDESGRYLALTSFRDRLEDRLSQWKDYMEGLENNSDDGRRKSARRMSVFLRKNLSASDPAGLPTGQAASKKPAGALMAPYSDFLSVIEKDMLKIEQHFDVQELESSIIRCLQTDGLDEVRMGRPEKDMVKLISTDKIEACIAKKVSMEARGMVLPHKLSLIFHSADVILDFRRAQLSLDWASVDRLIEVWHSPGALEEICSREMQVIRWESENRWMKTNLIRKIHEGKFDGALGHVPLDAVAYKELETAVSYCRDLIPRTDEVKNLVFTADAIVLLRRHVLCELSTTKKPTTEFDMLKASISSGAQPKTINWAAILAKCMELLSSRQSTMIHETSIPELTLFTASAEDAMLCASMRLALSRGGPLGEPGKLDLTALDVEEIAAVVDAANAEGTRTQTAAQLLNACKDIKIERLALRRTRDQDAIIASEARQAIQKLVEDRMSEDANKLANGDAGWAVCRGEILLLAMDTHLVAVRSFLIESITAALRVYAIRNTLSVTQLKKLNGAAKILPTDSVLDIVSLDECLAHSKCLDFQSSELQKYVGVCTVLRQLRVALMENDWNTVSLTVNEPDIQDKVSDLNEAVRELSMGRRELMSRRVSETMEHALAKTSSMLHSCTGPLSVLACVDHLSEGASSLPLESWEQDLAAPSGSAANRDVQHHDSTTLQEMLEEAINRCKSLTDNKSRLATDWLECGEYAFMMRHGIATGDTARVGLALNWLNSNMSICPDYIQAEASRANVIHDNDKLRLGLTYALSTGRAIGSKGNVDTTSVDTSELEKCLLYAREIKHKSAANIALVEAGEAIFHLRRAIQRKDIGEVHSSLLLLQSQSGSMLPIIVDEVAVARSELHDEITATALVCALGIFEDFVDDRCRKARARPDLTKIVGNVLFTEQDSAHAAGDTTPGDTSNHSSDSTYCYQTYLNGGDGDIGPDLIYTGILDEALDIARRHGVYSVETNRLLKTARLIRALREAMIRDDWTAVEEILFNANVLLSRLTNGPVAALSPSRMGELRPHFDRVAFTEIKVIFSQLELRSAMVGITKALRCGQASIQNGIIQISSLKEDALQRAIDRAKRYLPGELVSANTSTTELKHDSRYPVTPGGSAPVATKLYLQMTQLINSASVVLACRSALLKKKFSEAATIATKALSTCDNLLHNSVQDELMLYSIEITQALQASQLCAKIRLASEQGDLPLLSGTITDASSGQFGSRILQDLGMVLTLSHAHHSMDELLSAAQHLTEGLRSHDLDFIEKALEAARAVNYSTVPAFTKLRARLDDLMKLQQELKRCEAEDGGALSDKKSLRHMRRFAISLGLPNHPLVHHIDSTLQFSHHAMRINLIASACSSNSVYLAATETMRFKRAYLLQPGMAYRYNLDHFPNLRPLKEFESRSSADQASSGTSLLLHTDLDIPTSLTSLSPTLAAVSVWIFSHIIQGVEMGTYTNPEVQIRLAIRMCQACPVLRDEVLLQVVKQLRDNRDPESLSILWKVLATFLRHFPCSEKLESFLELFLYKSVKRREEHGAAQVQSGGRGIDDLARSQKGAQFISHTLAAKCCVRLLHESIFKFGYDQPIHSKDLSLRAYKIDEWLGDCFSRTAYDPGFYEMGQLIDEPLKVDLSSAVLSSKPESRLQNSLSEIKYGEVRDGPKKEKRETIADSVLQPTSNNWTQDLQKSASKGTWADWERRMQGLFIIKGVGIEGEMKPVSKPGLSLTLPSVDLSTPSLTEEQFVILLTHLMVAPASSLSLDQQALCYEVCNRPLVSHCQAYRESRAEHVSQGGSFFYSIPHVVKNGDSESSPLDGIGGTMPTPRASVHGARTSSPDSHDVRSRNGDTKNSHDTDAHVQKEIDWTSALGSEKLSRVRMELLDAVRGGPGLWGTPAESSSHAATDHEDDPSVRNNRASHRSSHRGDSSVRSGRSHRSHNHRSRKSSRSISPGWSFSSRVNTVHLVGSLASFYSTDGALIIDRVREAASHYWADVVVRLAQMEMLRDIYDAGEHSASPRNAVNATGDSAAHEINAKSVFPIAVRQDPHHIYSMDHNGHMLRKSIRARASGHTPHTPHLTPRSIKNRRQEYSHGSAVTLTPPMLRNIVISAMGRALLQWNPCVGDKAKDTAAQGEAATKSGLLRGLFKTEEDLGEFTMRRRPVEAKADAEL